ncbi:uncharacterized protein P884DRAFT_66975 [Thermothelomyces heterothallicus CBS 202.75]|uniref:uncharacterized protein n=1 Tax=Thermothelomyces heterothallicus CBS 202.75 TaxID=1149848 RepID=UPI0037449D58
MAGFFQKLKGAGSGVSKSDNTASAKSKKDEPRPDLTPLEKLLQNAGPIREDGSDKFFGLENFGNTCYCNSIVQALYHSEQFRRHVVNYPPPLPGDEGNRQRRKVNVTIRPPVQPEQSGNAAGPSKPRQSFGGPQLPPAVPPLRPEDKPDSPEYKKKQAMLRGPVLELAQESVDPSGMEECTFTALRDIFQAMIESQSRTGVISPQRFLDIFKRNNEMFRNSMHQDAHEFYGIVLNDVIANVEAYAKRTQELADSTSKEDPSHQAAGAIAMTTTTTTTTTTNAGSVTRSSGTGWVHDIFEGVLTSETRCLTCETASQRDETFLDLSIDLEEHSSVTACLLNFSAEEMLCERNKFHCDHCGGLQEAEKRMKVKKLPKILALHLKRFKYTEDYSRLQKLFHRVVYPYHLRMFMTTDDAEDPDRMYELYAVVVHIGGNAYHGHYVAVIKTKDRGWLLFDDEMVEPVDKHFVRNFFGDKPGMACAYVLFYQETTFEKVREEMDAEGLDQVKLATQTADTAATTELPNGSSTALLSKLNSQPLSPVDENETLATLDQARSAPPEIHVSTSGAPPPPPLSASEVHPLVAAPPPGSAVATEEDKGTAVTSKTKAQLAKEKKEAKAREKAEEKARKAAEKEQARLAAKERNEAQRRRIEAARLEREQLAQVLKESKRMAEEEEKRRRKEAGAITTTDTTTSSDAGAGGGGGGGGGGDGDGGDEQHHRNGLFNRAGRTSKSMTRKSFAFLHIGQNKDEDKGDPKGYRTDRSEAGESGSVQGESIPSSGAKENGAPYSHNKNGGGSNGNGNGTSSSSGGGGINGSPAKKPSNPFLARAIPRSDTAPGAVSQLRRTPDKHDREKDRDGKENQKPPLKERFSFGLGRKKSSRFLSSAS